MGPIGKEFVQVKIRSIHNNNRQNILSIENHDRGCCSISTLKNSVSIKRSTIKKGMILVNKEQIDKICYRFKSAIYIFSEKSISIKPGFSPIINAGTVIQSARVLKDDSFEEIVNDTQTGKQKIIKKVMGPGAITTLWFKFIQHPEHLIPGTLFTIRSGELQGIGMILDILPITLDENATPDILKRGRTKKLLQTE